MKYTKYFADIVKSNGVPALSQREFSRMMNIIHVEGVIRGYFKCGMFPNQHAFGIAVFKHQKTLTELTGNLTPEKLLEEMATASF